MPSCPLRPLSYARIGLFISIVVIGQLALPVSADDPSPLANSFFGVITVDGSPVPEGTPVSAWVEGAQLASEITQMVAGDSVVVLDVPADVPETPEIEGATPGQLVTFRIGGGDAPETGSWAMAEHVRIDLSAEVGADLSVFLDDGTSLVARGETVTYSLTVENLGPVDASSVQLRQTLPDYSELVSGDGGSLAGDTVEWPAFDLAAGDSTSRSVVVRIHPATPALVQQISSTATVSDDGTSGFDPDVSNNSAVDVDVLEAPPDELPDLAIRYDNLVVNPTSPTAGDSVSVSGVVRNVGLGPAIDAPVEIYDGDPDDGGTLLYSVLLDDMAAGGNQPFGFEWTATEGAHTLSVVVDPNGTMLEIGTDNNRTQKTVLVPRAAGPDLEVSGLDASALVQSPGDLQMVGQVQLDVRNLGDEPAVAPFDVVLFVDSDGDRVRGVGEPLLSTTTVESDLPAGAAVTVPLEVDGSTEFHHPLVWALADAADQVAEQREDNNQSPVFGCEEAPPAPSLEPVEDWWLQGVEIETIPIVVQLTDDNGDGAIDSRDVADIVFHTTDADGDGVAAVSGLDGSRIWTVRHSADLPVQGYLAQVAAGDLDGDGVAEIIGHRTDRRLFAVNHLGQPLWSSEPVDGVGPRGLGGPVLGDLDGDGRPEIAYGRTVLSATGEILAVGSSNQGQNYNYFGPFGTVLPPGWNSLPFSVIADIDLDGTNELVAGDASYRLVNGELEVIWDRTEPDNLMRDGFAGLGNFDADPYAEIVYLSSNQLVVINHDGSTFASRRVMIPFEFGQMPTYWGGPPTVADLDGDGVSEILTVGATHISAYRGNLSLWWRQPVHNDFGGVHGITAFDLDGDGTKEVLFADETTFHIYAGDSGEELYSRPNLTKTGNEHPIVADVDGDGRAEILLASNTFFDGDTSTRGLHVLGHPNWQGALPIYHQASYHEGGSLLDGTIPAVGLPSWQVANAFRASRELPPPKLYRPNLTVSLPRIGAASPAGIPVTLRVGNGGAELAPAGTRLALFAGDVGLSEPVLALQLDFGLRPGAWRDVTVYWTDVTIAGTAASAAIDWSEAGAPGLVSECDETDNSVDFVIEENLLADLAFESVTHSASEPVGQRVAFDVSVRNSGWADAEASTLRLVETPGGATLAENVIDQVPAGETSTFELLWDTMGHGAGTVQVELRLDAVDVVLEQDESNNFFASSLELTEPAAPDLSVDELAVEPREAFEGDVVRLTATVPNRGVALAGGFDIAFLVNGAEAGRVSSPADLAAGEVRQVVWDLDTVGREGFLVLEAVADPDGAIQEANEGNNVASSDVTVAASSLTATASSDQPSYGPNEIVTVTVTGQSTSPDPQDVVETVYVLDAAGARVADIAAQAVTVPNGASTRSYPWSTGSTPPGAYTVGVDLLQDGAVRARGISAFVIEEDLSAEATLSADRESYSPNAVAAFMGSLTNLSVNTTLTELAASLDIANASGAMILSVDLAVPALVPSATAQVDAQWPIENAPPGLYNAGLSLRDITGALIAYSSVAVAVEDSGSTGHGLEGGLTLRPNPVPAGTVLYTGFDLLNGGNAEMDDLRARVDLALQSDEITLASRIGPMPLAQGEDGSGGFGFDTEGLAADTYLASLVGVLPGNEILLDRVVFDLVPGLSVLDTSLAEGDSGSSQATFAVRLSEAQAEPIDVDYATADATAEAGLDYQSTSGVLTFAPGETEQQIQVTVFGDLEAEIDEVFSLVVSSSSGVAVADDQALATLLDEEGCQSHNLLANGDAELGRPVDPAESWTSDSAWIQRGGDPVALSGLVYFAPAGSGDAELVQTVDLSPFAFQIDGAGLELHFDGFTRSRAGSLDLSQIVIDYLDAAGAVLDGTEGAPSTPTDAWQAIVDRRTIPAGTRSARVRLRATADVIGEVESFFDRLSLRTLGVLTVTTGDVSIAEGDSGLQGADFGVSLSCSLPSSVALDVETADASARAGQDYLAVDETVSIAAGSLASTVSVDVVGDVIDEDDETFRLHVASADPNVVVLRSPAEAVVRDDDGAVAVSVADTSATEGSANIPGNGGVHRQSVRDQRQDSDRRL